MRTRASGASYHREARFRAVPRRCRLIYAGPQPPAGATSLRRYFDFAASAGLRLYLSSAPLRRAHFKLLMGNISHAIEALRAARE